jgi:hypothetical protein
MEKTTFLWFVRSFIFLIIFNALFFVIGGIEHNASVWISYGFINFAYIILLLTPKFNRAGKSSSVFWFSLYSTSATYFFLEFITGIIFILVAPEGFKAALAVQVCLAGFYFIILISHMIANERTADAEEKRQPQIAYIKNASAKLKLLLENISDKETKKKVERVYDAIYSSPVKSHPNLAETEERILGFISELECAIAAENKESVVSMANSLLLLINERNNLLLQK